MAELKCRTCGESEIRAWYPLDMSQTIELDGVDADGHVAFDYTGDEESGEAGPDSEYWCTNCDDHDASLEALLGLVEPAFELKSLRKRAAGWAAARCRIGTVPMVKPDLDDYSGFAR